MFYSKIIHILFDEQVTCESGAKYKKDYLTIVGNVALPFPGRVRDNVSTVQRTETNRGREKVSETVMSHPTGHYYYHYYYYIPTTLSSRWNISIRFFMPSPWFVIKYQIRSRNSSLSLIG